MMTLLPAYMPAVIAEFWRPNFWGLGGSFAGVKSLSEVPYHLFEGDDVCIFVSGGHCLDFCSFVYEHSPKRRYEARALQVSV